ncbi:chaperonin GroES [Gammaproteobacteria bacterium]
MKQQEKEKLWDVIESLPNDSEYKRIPNMPIPLGKSVIVKKIKQNVVQLGGIILPESSAENSQMPHVGIIYGIGPDCTKGVRAGLRCYYNVYADLEIRINGEQYVLMEENAVYYILRSNEQFISEGIKSEKQVRREKGQKEQDARVIRVHNHDQNEKDQYKESKKKAKIFAVTKK